MISYTCIYFMTYMHIFYDYMIDLKKVLVYSEMVWALQWFASWQEKRGSPSQNACRKTVFPKFGERGLDFISQIQVKFAHGDWTGEWLAGAQCFCVVLMVSTVLCMVLCMHVWENIIYIHLVLPLKIHTEHFTSNNSYAWKLKLFVSL